MAGGGARGGGGDGGGSRGGGGESRPSRGGGGEAGGHANPAPKTAPTNRLKALLVGLENARIQSEPQEWAHVKGWDVAEKGEKHLRRPRTRVLPSRSRGRLGLAGEREDRAALFHPAPASAPASSPCGTATPGAGRGPAGAGAALPFVVRAGRRGWGLWEREAGVGARGRTGAARLSDILTATTEVEAFKVNPNSTGNLMGEVKSLGIMVTPLQFR